MNRLRLWQKFSLLAMIGVGLVAAPFFLYIQISGKEIGATQTELQGVQPLRQLVQSLDLMQQHRGLSAMVLSGNTQARADRVAKQGHTKNTLTALDETLVEDSAEAVTSLQALADSLTRQVVVFRLNTVGDQPRTPWLQKARASDVLLAQPAQKLILSSAIDA